MMKRFAERFYPNPYQVGERIRIGGGPERRDWEVVNADDRRIVLRFFKAKTRLQVSIGSH